MSTPTTPQQKTPLHLLFVIVAALVALGFIIVGLLLFYERDAQAGTFATFFLAALAVVTSFAALVYQLGKQAADIAQIATNTNGTLSAEKQRSAVLEAQLVQNGITPATAGAAHTTPPPAT